MLRVAEAAASEYVVELQGVKGTPGFLMGRWFLRDGIPACCADAYWRYHMEILSPPWLALSMGKAWGSWEDKKPRGQGLGIFCGVGTVSGEVPRN